MKYIKIIILSLILLGIVFILSGCEVNATKEEQRFIRIASGDSYGIAVYYDKETKVEYAIKNNGHGGTSLTLLVDQEGKPLLYRGE